jgi:DNA-binding MarR family transcriptional regulator
VSQASPDRPSLDRLSAELVVYAGRLVRAVSRRATRDVPAAALRLLSQVDELGPSTIGHLAEADRCSQPTMSNAVQSLVDKGWARKLPNPADARSSLVELTGEGRAVLAAARRRHAAVVAERLRADPHHDEQDLATAVAVLKGLLETTDAPREGST